MNHHEGKAHFANKQSAGCLLQLMNVELHDGGKATVLWDGGATLSLITFRKATELGLTGKEVFFICYKGGWNHTSNQVI